MVSNSVVTVSLGVLSPAITQPKKKNVSSFFISNQWEKHFL